MVLSTSVLFLVLLCFKNFLIVIDTSILIFGFCYYFVKLLQLLLLLLLRFHMAHVVSMKRVKQYAF